MHPGKLGNLDENPNGRTGPKSHEITRGNLYFLCAWISFDQGQEFPPCCYTRIPESSTEVTWAHSCCARWSHLQTIHDQLFHVIIHHRGHTPILFPAAAKVTNTSSGWYWLCSNQLARQGSFENVESYVDAHESPPYAGVDIRVVLRWEPVQHWWDWLGTQEDPCFHWYLWRSLGSKKDRTYKNAFTKVESFCFRQMQHETLELD